MPDIPTKEEFDAANHDLTDRWNDFIEVLSDMLDIELKTDPSTGRQYLDILNTGYDDLRDSGLFSGTNIAFATIVTGGALLFAVPTAILFGFSALDIPIHQVFDFIMLWIWDPFKFNIGLALGLNFTLRISLVAMLYAICQMNDWNGIIPFTDLVFGDLQTGEEGVYSGATAGFSFPDLGHDFSEVYLFYKLVRMIPIKSLLIMIWGAYKSKMLRNSIYDITDRLKDDSTERDYDSNVDSIYDKVTSINNKLPTFPRSL